MDEVFDSFQSAPTESSPHLETFGHYLRQRREDRQVSIEELSWATKIKVEYIYAMEAGDYSLLPGEIFTKGYLRSYSEYLGLDPSETVTRFVSCKKGQCAPSVEISKPQQVTWLTRFLNWIDRIKKLVTGREDFQVY